MTFLKLIRVKNLLMVLLIMILTKYALIEGSLREAYLSDIEFIIFAVSVLLITAGGYIINDIYDVKVDQINKPDKTYIGNSISIKNAWLFYITFSIVGLGLGIFLSIDKGLSRYAFLFLFGFFCLFFYSKYLQKTPFLGNLVIAFICGALIYLLYLFDFRLTSVDRFVETTQETHDIDYITFGPLIIDFYIIFSFLGTLIREIVKDIEDVDGDYNAGYKTLPIVLGKKRARNLAIALSCVFALILIFYCLTTYAIRFYYLFAGLLVVTLATVIFLYRLWFASTKKHFHDVSTIMKTIMLLGILSMLLYKSL